MASVPIESVRAAVRREFEKVGCRDQLIEEVILLNNANYFGHRFIFKKYCAVWQLDADVLTIYSDKQQINQVPVAKSDKSYDKAA